MFAPDAPGELGEGLSNPDMPRRPTMRREAQSTSALEGTFEPLETVLAQDYEVGEDKSGLSESMREVLNYLDAAECGIGQIQSGHPISLHSRARIAEASCEGHEVRQSTGLGNTIHPSVHRLTHAAHRGCAFRAHASRANRAVAGAVADDEPRPASQPLLSVSPWFERRRPEYQDRLLGVSTKGDWDDWILFFCQDIEESCEDALLRVKRLVNVRQRYRSLLDEHRYSGLSVQTAMYLIGQPTVTASMLRRRFGKSPSAVQHALSRLVSVGILRAYPAGRGNLHIAPDIHKVLAAPLGAAIDVSAPLMCERGE